MACFTVFRLLPIELQDIIWTFSAPGPEPEVCIVWPLAIHDWKGEQPVLPFIVDTAWPTVAHVCRDTRSSLVRSGTLRLRHSPTAGFVVPCRAFDPAIDTLYWGQSQAGAMHLFFRNVEHMTLARSLRHVAVEVPATYPPSALAEFIRQRAVFLRTLALIVPDLSDNYSIRTAFLPPARRCQLRDVSDDVLSKITLTEVPFLEPDVGGSLSLREYVERYRADLDHHVRKFALLADEGTAWSTDHNCFSGLEIKVQTFVQYTTGQWVEACGRRKLGQGGRPSQPRYVPRTDRKSPDEYRVLDDDCGWFDQVGPDTGLVPEGYQVPLEYEMELGLRGW